MNILFITSSRIGDAVLSSGLLASLAERYPNARFVVACGAPVAPLFAAAPFVAQVIPMVKRRRAGHWLDLWRQCVGTFWHLVVDLRGSAMGWILPTLRRQVLRQSWRQEHRVVHLARVLGLDKPAPPVLWATPEQSASAAQLLPDDGPILAVGPAANWGGKQWSAVNFATTINELTGPDGILPSARVAVFAAPNERDAVLPVLNSIDPARCIDLIGQADLPTIYACLRRCAFYLGNDSGLMHMAAAAGIPTLGLFGPSSEIFYGPWGERSASVRGPRSFEDICHALDFDHRSQASLMTDLTVARVVEAARTHWQAIRRDDV